jgi:putative AlgH/UPF0301 family transcriptional regulator
LRKNAKKKRYYMTPQAAAIMLTGIFVAAFPFIVLHSGYSGEIVISDDRVQAPFDKSIVLVDEDGIEGAIGVVVNKPLSAAQRSRLTAFIRDSDIPVGYGGPLGLYERIIVLEEKKPAKPSGKIRIELNDWDDAIRAEPDLLNRIRQSIKNGDQQYRVFTGLASWSPFQLASEVLVKGSWYAMPATHDLIFQNGAAKWEELEPKEKARKNPNGDQS